jgi:tetratricopeptide (TPR) repeat protein
VNLTQKHVFEIAQLQVWLLVSVIVLCASSWAQMVGFPAEEHLVVSPTEAKAPKQLVAELVSARQSDEKYPSAQNDLLLGRALKAIGETDAAARLFDRALTKNPKLSDGWLEKGFIESNRGDWSKAAELFRNSLFAAPANGPAHLALGEMLLRIGDFDGAAKELKTASEIDPRSCGSHQGLGLVYLQQGKAVESERESRTTLACADSNEARKGLARVLAYEHKWQEAAALLQRIAAANPNSSEAVSALATALSNLGDKAGSEREFTRARELSQKELIVLRAKGDRNWGVSLRNEGKLQDSAVAFRHALETDPTFCDVHDDLGEVLWIEKDLASALIEFQEAAQCNPNSATAENNLGAALLYYRHDVDSAIERLRVAINAQPGFALARLNLGKAFAAKQDFSAAEPELRAAIAIDPDLAAAHLNLGLILAAKKGSMSAEAQKELQTGLRLDPRLRGSVPRQYVADLQ